MATYVSELRRNADTKQVKVVVSENNTIVEKIVVGKPISAAALARTGLGNFKELLDATDSNGNRLSGTTDAVADGSLLVVNKTTGNIETAKNRLFAFNKLEFIDNEIRTSSDTSTLILNPYPSNDSGLVVIKGDLRVDGTTTTVNSTEVSINDKALILADSGGTVRSDFNDAGIILFTADSTEIFGTTSPNILYDATADVWNFSRSITVQGINLTGDISLSDSSLKTFLDSNDFQFSAGVASIQDEAIQDVVGAMIAGQGTNIEVFYNDVNGTLEFEVALASNDSAGVALFDATNFNVTAGAVTVNTVDGGTY
jgi:hypothetical protein